MTDSTGSSLRRTSSSAIEGWTGSIGGSLVICLTFGVLIVLADVFLRLPLHMPGWRGLIGMALLILARRLTRQPWGASLAALAAAVASFYAGEAMRFGPFAYLLPGLVIDLVLLSLPQRTNAVLAAGIAGALGNLGKFLVVVLGAVMFGPKSLSFGVAGAALAHLVFGFCGGALAACLVRRRSDGANAPGNVTPAEKIDQ